MPGRYFLTRPDKDIEASSGVPLAVEDTQRWNISPGQNVRALSDTGWHEMRWGMIPVGRKNARGRPVMETIVNARSETVFDKSAFDGVRRAVVPADGWYEWTGETRRKTAWAIKAKDNSLLWFAAIFDIWAAPNGAEVMQLATVTCEPSADVREIHHRMGVILSSEDISQWLTGTEQQARALMRPFPDGRLRVDEAKNVDWSKA